MRPQANALVDKSKSTCFSWSKAPARNVSAHTSAGLKPLRLKWYAYFVQVVVFPQPCATCDSFATAEAYVTLWWITTNRQDGAHNPHAVSVKQLARQSTPAGRRT